MPTYNDPAMAQAFSNLGKLFAPPSGSDIYAYAKAREANADAGAHTSAYSILQDPNATPQQRDLANLLLGNAPYYMQAQTTADTARRGQDIQSQTDLTTNQRTNDQSNVNSIRTVDATKRGQDIEAETSRGNNTQNVNEKFTEFLFAPRKPNEITPAIPGDVAGRYGDPARAEARGMITLDPGQVSYQPDGSQIAGPAKPLTLEEAKAAEFQKLRQGGQMTDNNVMGILQPEFAKPVNTVGPDGKPRLQAAIDAEKSGASTIMKTGSEAESIQLADRLRQMAPDDPQRAGLQARMDALGAPKRPYETTQEKISGQALGDLDNNIYNNARTAQSQKQALDVMKQIASDPNFQSGTGTDLKVAARKALSALGYQGGDVSDAELFGALANQMALGLKDKDGKTTMPGAMSDNDVRFLTAMAPQLATSPQGNAKLLDYYGRIADRATHQFQLRNAYAQAHGGQIDDGFKAALLDDDAKNPLFTAEDYNQAQIGTSGRPTPPPQAAPQAPGGPTTVAPPQAAPGAPQAPGGAAPFAEGKTIYDKSGKAFIVKNGVPVPVGQ